MFNCTMASKSKRLKLEEAREEASEDTPAASIGGDQSEEENDNENRPKNILSLDDDCFYTIFEKISMDDLIEMSQTCKRIHGVCAGYFSRRYKEKVLIIDGVSENETPNYAPKNEKYVVAFAKYIRNVTLGKKCAVNLETLRRLTTYFEKPEVASIKQVRFEGWHLRKSHRHLLANTLKDIESVSFSKTRVFGDLNECALKFMENMKELTLSKTFNEPDDENTTWMQQKYPKLEQFNWHVSNRELSIAKLKQFFVINPNIKFFSLLTKSSDIVNQLITENIRVTELFFECTPSSNLSESFEILLALCETQACHLHLKFKTQVRLKMEELGKLVKLAPYFEGLYSDNLIADTLAKRLITFDHLKVLQCDIFENVKLLANIPNLEEIHLIYSCYFILDYELTMMTYASRSVKLKKIYLGSRQLFGEHLERLPLQKMDMERLKLNATHKLKIYVPSRKMDIMTASSEFERNYNTVEVIRTETEVVKNPFVNI